MPKRPNVILICVDQWRGDCLSVDGHPVVQTPHLDELALEGARFSRAYAACPTCIPARAALFTGLTQRRHGRIGYRDGVPWDYPVTLAGEFTRHGYQTQAIGKMHVFPERSQMGFQNVILHDGFLHFTRSRERNYDMLDDYLPWLREQLGRDADDFDHGVHCNSIVARPWDKPEHLHPTSFIVTQAIDFLRRRDPRKPFFLFLSFHRPHPPYDPPAWAFEQYARHEMPGVPVGDWADLFAPYSAPHRPDCFVGPIAPRVLHAARAGYYGHMTHIDHQIDRFLRVLHDYDLRDNSYTCFTSDHGEMMGDHHLFRKGYPYEGSARVPMLLKGPSDSGIRPDARHNQVVELRDVMPTLLDCAGLPIPEGVEGQSFLPIARGEESEWRDQLHGEHILFDQSLHWITDGHEKYIWFSGSGHEQLFRLDDDPQELHDLARQASWADRVAHWRQVLVEELSGREEGFSDGERLIAGQPVQPCLAVVREEAGLESSPIHYTGEPAAEGSHERHAARILVVDDDEEIVASLRALLQSEGYVVDCALSARAGLAQIRGEDSPDLVILDIMMETMTAGAAMAHEIRHATPRPDLPLIMLSSINQQDAGPRLSQRDLDEGWVPAQRFIEKPYIPDEICQTVHELLSAKQGQEDVGKS